MGSSLGQEEANIVGGEGDGASRPWRSRFFPPLLDSSFELVRAEVRFPDYRKSIADGPLRTPILGSRRDPRRAAVCSHLNIIASRLRELFEIHGESKKKEEGGRNGMVPS